MVIEKAILFKINDLNIDLEITKVNSDCYEFKISVSYNFLISYQKNTFRITLDKIALKNMINDIMIGKKSSYGSGNIWQTNKIFIKKPNPLVHYRNVWLYRRFFILGFCFIPATISLNIIESLKTFNI